MLVKMGRPRFPEGECRSERIATMLTKAERAVLTQQAASAAMSLSAYCHQLIAEGLKKQMKNKEK